MQIVDGKLVPTISMTISEEAATRLSEFRMEPGNVVIGRRGEMGRCAVVQPYQNGWLCGTGSVVIRVAEDVDERYLRRVLSSPATIRAIENTSVGTTMTNLNQSTLSNLLIALPTLAEQEAIASALSDADALIESLEQLLAKKRQIKQGAMQELLTGDWPRKPFGDLFNFSGGYSASRDDLGSSGHLYLHYGDIHGSQQTFIDVETDSGEIPRIDIPLNEVSPASLLDDGDVVFVDASEDVDGTNKHVVIDNPKGKPFISGLHTIVGKRITSELNPRFMRYCFQTPEIKEQFRFFAVGTKVSGVSKSSIAKIMLAVPEFASQTRIASTLDVIEQEIELLAARVSKVRQLKQAMMQQLLTGRIRLV
jgi:type I restriction enzyme S subunit